VGGNSFGRTKLTNIATDYTFEGNASGDISFNYTQESAKAIYIKSITITYTPSGEVPKTDRALLFEEKDFTVDWDGSSSIDFAEPALNGVTAGVAYSSSVETVATVNPGTGEITITGYGATTITAAAEETETYKAGEDSYTIKVIEPVSNVEYEAAMVSVKNDVYYAMSTEQGDERLYAVVVDVVNGKVIDNDDATIKWQVDESVGTIRNGEKYAGHVSSSSIALNNKSYAWGYADGIWYTKTENRYLGLGSGVSDYYFRAYSNSNNNMTLYPPAIAMTFVDGYVRAATIGRFGTICLPCAVAAVDMSGMEVYSIAGKRMEGETPVALILEQVEAMEAGKPYIFKATASKIVAAYSGEPAGATSANGLVGVHEGITLTASSNAHVLSNNAVKKVTGNVTVGDNRAYINIDQVPVFVESGNAKRFVEIGYGDIVNNIDAVAEQTLVDVYNITGVRIRSGVKKADATVGLKKGLYIVGGRKVIIR
jgi:hypothetical protein